MLRAWGQWQVQSTFSQYLLDGRRGGPWGCREAMKMLEQGSPRPPACVPLWVTAPGAQPHPGGKEVAQPGLGSRPCGLGR